MGVMGLMVTSFLFAHFYFGMGGMEDKNKPMQRDSERNNLRVDLLGRKGWDVEQRWRAYP